MRKQTLFAYPSLDRAERILSKGGEILDVDPRDDAVGKSETMAQTVACLCRGEREMYPVISLWTSTTRAVEGYAELH